MIRLLFSLIVLTFVALGLAWLSDMPGGVTLTLMGFKIEASLAVATVAVVTLAIALTIVWSILRFVFRLPSLISIGWHARQRHKGHLAVSRGMIAVGAGDSKLAHRSASEAIRLLGREPLALLLSAQAAQMEGDGAGAARAFHDMLASPDTKLLGLRGLYIEAQRAGRELEAVKYAEETVAIAPKTAWAVDALMEHHARTGDWQKALMALDHGSGAFERQDRKRKRAVLLTADALSHGDGAPELAIDSAREAAKLAPDLVPAQTAFARLLSRQGNYRKASRLLEAAWRLTPHPDLAEAYLSIRPGDAARERLARAKKLMALKPDHPESRYALARTYSEARDFDKAREAIAPLLEPAPTVRVCLLMAELEQLEHGDGGHVREWLGRASHAPRDPSWIGDGLISDVWAAVSPISGKLDVFTWAKPAETVIDRRFSEVLNGTLRSLGPVHTPANGPQETIPSVPGMKKTLSASAFLASQAKEGDRPSPTEIRSPTRKSKADVIFPLAHSPDDPGPGSE